MEQDAFRRFSVEFLSSRGGLQRLQIIRRALAPQLSLIHFLLSGNTPSWEVAEMSKTLAGADRHYHLSDFHHACKNVGKVKQVHVELLQELCAPQAWLHFTPSEAMASHMSRVFFRVAAATHHLLLSRGLGFPARLFGLLQSDSDAAAILHIHATKPCLLDSWSLDFLNHHASLEQLLSAEARLLLSTAGLLIMTNTFDTERLHSKGSIRNRANRNHSMSLADLAVWHLKRANPEWAVQEHPKVE